MKKVVYILLVILFALTICSCIGTKKITKNNKETIFTEKQKIKRDSINIAVINKSISDALTIPVIESNTNNKAQDSIINSKVDEILSKLNTSKKSGNNSYRLNYNIENRLLELETKVGETKDTSIDTKTEEITEKTFEEKTDEYINKKIRSIPWWVYCLISFWFFPQILARIQAFINPISNLLKK